MTGGTVALRTLLAILFVYREHILKSGGVPSKNLIEQLSQDGYIGASFGMRDYIERARNLFDFGDEHDLIKANSSMKDNTKLDVDEYMCSLTMLRLMDFDEHSNVSRPCLEREKCVKLPCLANIPTEQNKCIGAECSTMLPNKDEPTTITVGKDESSEANMLNKSNPTDVPGSTSAFVSGDLQSTLAATTEQSDSQSKTGASSGSMEGADQTTNRAGMDEYIKEMAFNKSNPTEISSSTSSFVSGALQSTSGMTTERTNNQSKPGTSSISTEGAVSGSASEKMVQSDSPISEGTAASQISVKPSEPSTEFKVVTSSESSEGSTLLTSMVTNTENPFEHLSPPSHLNMEDMIGVLTTTTVGRDESSNPAEISGSTSAFASGSLQSTLGMTTERTDNQSKTGTSSISTKGAVPGSSSEKMAQSDASISEGIIENQTSIKPSEPSTEFKVVTSSESSEGSTLLTSMVTNTENPFEHLSPPSHLNMEDMIGVLTTTTVGRDESSTPTDIPGSTAAFVSYALQSTSGMTTKQLDNQSKTGTSSISTESVISESGSSGKKIEQTTNTVGKDETSEQNVFSKSNPAEISRSTSAFVPGSLQSTLSGSQDNHMTTESTSTSLKEEPQPHMHNPDIDTGEGLSTTLSMDDYDDWFENEDNNSMTVPDATFANQDPQFVCKPNMLSRPLSELKLVENWQGETPMYVNIAPDGSLLLRSAHVAKIRRKIGGKNHSMVYVHTSMEAEMLNENDFVFTSHASSIFVASLNTLKVIRSRKLLRVPYRSSTFGLAVDKTRGLIYVGISPIHSVVLVDSKTLRKVRSIRIPVNYNIDDIVLIGEGIMLVSSRDGIYGVDGNDTFLGRLVATPPVTQMQLDVDKNLLWVVHQPCAISVFKIERDPVRLTWVGERSFKEERALICSGLAFDHMCHLYMVDVLRHKILLFN